MVARLEPLLLTEAVKGGLVRLGGQHVRGLQLLQVWPPSTSCGLFLKIKLGSAKGLPRLACSWLLLKLTEWDL